MTKTYSGLLQEVNFVKDGLTNGRSWAMYSLKFEDGFRATDFSEAHKANIGKNITIEVESRPSTKNGKTYENWTVVTPKPAKKGMIDPKQMQTVIAILQRIEKKIDGLGVIRTANVEEMPPIQDEDIPF